MFKRKVKNNEILLFWNRYAKYSFTLIFTPAYPAVSIVASSVHNRVCSQDKLECQLYILEVMAKKFFALW